MARRNHSKSYSITGTNDILRHMNELETMQTVRTAVAKHTWSMSDQAGANTPVVTGNLRRSKKVYFEDGGLTGIVEYDIDKAPYAPLIEYGGYNSKNGHLYRSQRYLGRAFDVENGKFRNTINNDLLRRGGGIRYD